MTTSFTSRNTLQRIPELPINSRIVLQPGIHYTCPAEKKAIFNGYVVCTNRGAAANASLRDPSDSFNICTWFSTTQTTISVNLVTDERFFLEMELTAGQTIKTVQSSGTNAEFEVIGKILELPA